MSGKYERAISIFRAAYTWVSQSRADAPGRGRVWFGQYAPHSSTHVPVYVGAGRVPRAFATGNLRALDRGALYWAHALVGNWAARFWIHCRDDVGAHGRVGERGRREVERSSPSRRASTSRRSRGS